MKLSACLATLVAFWCLVSKSVADDSATSTDDDDGTPYMHFIAHNLTMTCSADQHARPFNNQLRGTSLGGWMVVEPWIAPSLFYQFIGGNETSTAFDTYTFCQVLGAKEANRQLRNHWDRWVTEDIIKDLAREAEVNSLRLPVGDYMYVPYGPYKGCFDGALEKVEQLLDWAYTYGLSVLIDIHTMKDSQNGFDNSGQARGFAWTSALSSEFSPSLTFQHWPIREASWIGTWDPSTASYSSINYDNIQHALDVIQKVVDTYSGHPAVLGLEPLNEPWQYTPLPELKRFYWEGYLIVKKKAPYWKYVMHDSFRLDPNVWGGFMDGCPERALDTHIYQAWKDPDSRLGFFTDACSKKEILATMEREFGPVIVGEWSLATDNCAMWLNGFNDNLPGFPRSPCKYTPCAESYLGESQPGVPLDPSKPIQGPFGTGMSAPTFGLCPGDRDWIKESGGDPLSGRDWVTAPPRAPKRLDDTDDVMKNLALKKLDAFSGVAHGYYFWNFRTELYLPQWSYTAALQRGWIPRGSFVVNPHIANACVREDDIDFNCILKKGQLDSSIRDAAAYVFKIRNTTSDPENQAILNMTGTDLRKNVNKVIGEYFQNHKHAGATCDFGGVAMLVSESRTPTDDDTVFLTDDEYFGVIVRRGPKLWQLVLGGVAVAAVSGLVGFIVAMRSNPRFNARVRSSRLFLPISNSRNSLIRSSLNLPALEDYDEIQDLINREKEHLEPLRF